MERIFKINNIVASVFGLPTMAVFISEDNLHVFKYFGPPSKLIAWLALSIVVITLLLQIWKIIFDPTRTICRNVLEVNRKMLSIVAEDGNTCILSRNLSWADGQGLMDALLRKAKSGDLTLFVNQENKASSKLKEAGAKVVLYKGSIPKCRFTIKGHGSAHSRLYIAKANSPSHHVIHLHSEKDDVTLRLAEDLIHMLDAKS